MRRWTLIALGSVAVIALVGLAGGCTSRSHVRVVAAPRSAPGTRATAGTPRTTALLTPVDLEGRSPTQKELDTIARIVERRFIDAGLPSPSITNGPAHTLRFAIQARIIAEQIQQLADRGVFAVRAVLGSTTALPAPRPIPSKLAPPSDLPATLDKAKAHVGATAYALAQSLTAPPTNKAIIAKLAAFGTLSAEQVAALPARMQFRVPTITCAQLNARSPLFLTDSGYLDRQVTACDETEPNLKYLLGPAEVRGGDVARATAEFDPENYAPTGGWLVELDFAAAGEQKVVKLTSAQVGKQIGILMDGTLVSAPYIQETVTGPVTAVGPYTTNAVAHRIAELVNDGSLPFQLAVTDVSTN